MQSSPPCINEIIKNTPTRFQISNVSEARILDPRNMIMTSFCSLIAKDTIKCKL